MGSLSSDPANLAFAVRVLSPQDLSTNMQARPPTNLNVQSQNATIELIDLVLTTLGIEISELYVDALGPPVPYQRMLAQRFPQIEKVVVEAKADAKYTIVGAASVAAKVTRDAWIEGWVFTEDEGEGEKWSKELGSGYPSGANFRLSDFQGADGRTQIQRLRRGSPNPWIPCLGTPHWRGSVGRRSKSSSINPHTRSYGTCPSIPVARTDSLIPNHRTDDGQTIARSFESAKARDKGRCNMAKELAIRSVGSL